MLSTAGDAAGAARRGEGPLPQGAPAACSFGAGGSSLDWRACGRRSPLPANQLKQRKLKQRKLPSGSSSTKKMGALTTFPPSPHPTHPPTLTALQQRPGAAPTSMASSMSPTTVPRCPKGGVPLLLSAATRSPISKVPPASGEGRGNWYIVTAARA